MDNRLKDKIMTILEKVEAGQLAPDQAEYLLKELYRKQEVLGNEPDLMKNIRC